MNNKPSTGFSFIDFITEVAQECLTPNGSEASPYDVDFANHYQSLYAFENDNKAKNKVPEIAKVIQNNKKKSVTAEFEPSTKIDEAKIKDYCNSHNLEYNIQDGYLKSVTINKNSKGVMEERKWAK